MYVIEVHQKYSASTHIVLEKQDAVDNFHEKPFRTIINHTGDNDLKHCTWCRLQQLERSTK